MSVFSSKIAILHKMIDVGFRPTTKQIVVFYQPEETFMSEMDKHRHFASHHQSKTVSLNSNPPVLVGKEHASNNKNNINIRDSVYSSVISLLWKPRKAIFECYVLIHSPINLKPSFPETNTSYNSAEGIYSISSKNRNHKIVPTDIHMQVLRQQYYAFPVLSKFKKYKAEVSANFFHCSIQSTKAPISLQLTARGCEMGIKHVTNCS